MPTVGKPKRQSKKSAGDPCVCYQCYAGGNRFSPVVPLKRITWLSKALRKAYFAKGRHIITVQTEHSAVLDPCGYLESLGFEVTYLPVKPDGLLDLDMLEKAFRDDTILVSVMAANNEIGVLQPLAEIGQRCRDRNVLFHSDAAQAIGKIPLDVQTMQIDLLSLTAPQSLRPQGNWGALCATTPPPPPPRVQLAAQLHGGGQERGRRSGTLYPPQIVGFGKAVELAMAEMEPEGTRQAELRRAPLVSVKKPVREFI